MAFSPTPPPNALTIRDAAQLAGVSRRTVERWAQSGLLRFGYFGPRRFTTRDDLDRFLRRRSQSSANRG